MGQTKESYLANGRLAQQDKLDTAARLRRRSGRVCHDDRSLMQVHEHEGVVALILFYLFFFFSEHEDTELSAGEESRKTAGLSAGCRRLNRE